MRATDSFSRAWAATGQRERGAYERLALLSRGYGDRARELLIDRRLGVDTAGRGADHCVHDSDAELVGYTPAHWWVLPTIFSKLRVAPSDVFMDIGCGKGRALIVAARRYPFRRVLGIELDPALAAIAVQNVAALKRRGLAGAGSIEVIEADAREFEVPTDLTVCYFNNPFTGEVFESVLDNILSAGIAVEKLQIVYINPVMDSALVERGFKVVAQREDPRQFDWRVYARGVPAAGRT